MQKISLSDNEGSFEATVLEPARPTRLVLFSVGSGGNPERHLPLLSSLAANGCLIVAPHFDRIVSARPTAEELLQRARRLKVTLDSKISHKGPVNGIGHSIGASLILALAGGQMWMGPEQLLPIENDKRLSKLVLITPATGFFQAPYALDRVTLPMLIWAGTKDEITPPAQAEFLKKSLEARNHVDLRIVEEAGHFSFMNTLPPTITDSFQNREAFLENFAKVIYEYLSLTEFPSL